jgi:serine O-acetyltransferase
MKLASINLHDLAVYVSRQLANIFPDGNDEHPALITACMSASIERTLVCLDSVKAWRAGGFDCLHTSHCTTFLYFLANEIWKNSANRHVCNKLFALNKCLNGIDLFYEIEMPARFLIGHSTGIVLAKASYGDYLMLCQNSTIGRYHDRYPKIGTGTILYPNCAIVGSCDVGDNTILSQGSSLIDSDSPGNCIVLRSNDGAPAFKPVERRYADDYFWIT